LSDTWDLLVSLPIAQNLRELNIRGCKSINDDVIRKIIRYCTRLESLNLAATSISDSAFELYSELTQADLFMNASKNDQTTNRLSRKRKQDTISVVQEVELADSEHTDHRQIEDLPHKIIEDSVNRADFQNTQPFCELLPAKCLICVSHATISKHFPHLTKLTISGCINITNKGNYHFIFLSFC
jgi:hypothetical protein